MVAKAALCWCGSGINCRCIPCMVTLQSSLSKTVPSLSFAWQILRAATICLSRNASNRYVNWIRMSFLPSSLKEERNRVGKKDENQACKQQKCSIFDCYHSFLYIHNINGLLNCNILLCLTASTISHKHIYLNIYKYMLQLCETRHFN